MGRVGRIAPPAPRRYVSPAEFWQVSTSEPCAGTVVLHKRPSQADLDRLAEWARQWWYPGLR